MVLGLGTATLALLIGIGDSVAIGFFHGMGIDQPSWYDSRLKKRVISASPYRLEIDRERVSLFVLVRKWPCSRYAI